MKYLLILVLTLFCSASAKADISKGNFKVFGDQVSLSKDHFNVSTDVKCGCEKCECKDCKCDGDKCKCENCKKCKCDKCKCGDNCKCENGNCKCDGCKNPLQIKRTKESSYESFYNHILNGGNGVFFVGDAPIPDEKIGVWRHAFEFPGLSDGVWDCKMYKGEPHFFKRPVKLEVQNSCPNGNCPTQNFYYYNSCPNGKCNK